MFLHTVLRTNIIPPPRGARTLVHPRVGQNQKQAFDYRLTILQAGAGYDKSTALAERTAETQPIVWYQVSDEDNDPLVFLLHICHAIQRALPVFKALPHEAIPAIRLEFASPLATLGLAKTENHITQE